MKLRTLPLLLAAALPLRAEDAPKPVPLLRQIEQGFVEVYERVAPVVVVIESTRKPEADSERTTPFDLLLRDEDSEAAKKLQEKLRLPPASPQNEGSGFIIRADGFILTNRHVIEDAEKIHVRLRDGRRLPARLIGADDKTDIAVVKVEATGLPAAEWGDSEALRVGQLVCAIGVPYNQDWSFTAGWVSGKGRSGLLAGASPTLMFEDYIQTDAFINPGNSGGPLFDIEGRVLGMNTLINGLGRGLAFAIPASMLRPVADALIAGGRVQRPWLGIRIESLANRPQLREHTRGVEDGVVVDTITGGGPAFGSELRAADIITEVDGVRVKTVRDLQRQVLGKKIGQTLTLTIWRSGTTLKMPLTTGELPDDPLRVANPQGK